jgi:GTPase SAR1 family protein
MSDNHSPIYLNISTNTGINSNAELNLSNQPSQIKFVNDDSIALDPSLYYLSLNRALINTASVPAYIFPIKNGLTQTNRNLSPFKIRFEYYNAGAFFIYGLTKDIIFQSQVLDQLPKPPSQNGGLQDFETAPFYYYVYDVAWMLKIFNDNIKATYQEFCTNLLGFGVSLDTALYPFYTYNFSSRLFSLNFPISLYDQDTYPQVSFYTDNLSGDLFACPSNTYFIERDTNYLMLCYDLHNNTVEFNSIPYYAMSASENPLSLWCPIKRILFSITDIPTKLEIESSFNNTPFEAQQNNSFNSLSKPNLNIFFDLAVNQDDFAVNRNYVQYSVSSIAESRLVSIGSGNIIRNFTINIFWVDTFGNFRPLLAGGNTQNNIKLAFYRKTTMLL